MPKAGALFRDPRVQGLLGLLVFGLAVPLALHGIANDFLPGPDGERAAAALVAARNSLRFHVLGAAPAYAGLVPPPPSAFAVDAPPLSHVHVTAAVALLGDAPWVPRLVPVAYFLATGLLLFGLVRARRGTLAASATVLVYTLVPLAATSATFVRPAAGGLFFALLFVAASLRFEETRNRRAAIVALVALALATQFDRACHVLAVVAALDGLVRARRGSPDERRSSTAFAAAIVLASLASASLDAAFVLSVRGSFGVFASGARSLAAGLGADLVRVLHLAHALVGKVFLVLLGAYLLLLPAKRQRGGLDALDRVALSFLLVSLGVSLVSHHEAALDACSLLYLLPSVALATSSFLPPAGERARLRALGGLGLSVCLLVAVPETVSKVRARFVAGFDPTAEAYDDRYVELAAWKHALASVPAERREVFVHASVPVDSLLLASADAPVRPFRELADVVATHPSNPGAHRLVLVDLMTAGAVPGLPEAVAAHRATIHQGRFLLLDLEAPGRALVGYRIRPLPMGRWWPWLVNPSRPPVTWDPIG